MSDLSLHLDKPNEIVLKVEIACSEPVEASPDIRLVCESNDVMYSFRGSYNETGDVEIAIPAMKGRLTEGTYDSKLEVIIQDKIFHPLEIGLKFVESVKVTAEIVSKPVEKKTNTIKASIVKKPAITERQSSKKEPETFLAEEAHKEKVKPKTKVHAALRQKAKRDTKTKNQKFSSLKDKFNKG